MLRDQIYEVLKNNSWEFKINIPKEKPDTYQLKDLGYLKITRRVLYNEDELFSSTLDDDAKINIKGSEITLTFKPKNDEHFSNFAEFLKASGIGYIQGFNLAKKSEESLGITVCNLEKNGIYTFSIWDVDWKPVFENTELLYSGYIKINE